jgi:hypothetical protein
MSSKVQTFFREFGYGMGTTLIAMGFAKGCWYLAHHYIPFVSVKSIFGMKKKRQVIYETPIFPHISDVEGRKVFFDKVYKESTQRLCEAGKKPTGKEDQQWQQLKQDVNEELERLMVLNAVSTSNPNLAVPS